MITTDIRLRAASQQEADQIIIWLTTRLGDAVQFTAPHIGRSDGVWFIRGTLRIDLAQPMIDVAFCDTGEIASIPDPRPATVNDPAVTTRLARLAGLSRPETRPDDGVDRRALHKQWQARKDKEPES